jgi:long-chain acyl-CoA synthetase
MKFLTEVSGPPITEDLSSSWIFDRIEEWALRFPDRFAFAVDHQDRVEEYKYADVVNQSEWIALGLAANGIQPGDRVGILMENIPQWVFALLGAMRLGAITVPLATTLPEDALRRIIIHSGCKLLFADGHNLEKASTLAESGLLVVAFNGSHSCALAWNDFQIRNLTPASRKPMDGEATAVIVYTSGTTGEPKGVQLTALNLVYEVYGILDAFRISPDHRVLSVLPFSHILPLIANGIGPLCVGAGVVFLSSISPQRIVEAFHKHRITLFICVPQFFYVLHKRIFAQVQAQPWIMRRIFSLMLRLSRAVNNKTLSRRVFARIHNTIGPNLTIFASGGSKFDNRVARDLSDLGYVMLQAYGLTETSAAATATPLNENRVGTVGKPIRGVSIRIDSPNEEGVGEVLIRGPLVMKGYYRDELKTAEVIRSGWFYAGDLGFLYPDGNLVITGRSKDVIVLPSGKNVYPEELETHYGQSTFIKEICILGIPDADGPEGEKLHAIVVPDMDEFRSRGQTGIMEMIRFEMENYSRLVPSWQRIHSLSIRNEPFPRTVTRKLKRFEIQVEEAGRSKRPAETLPGGDHPKFLEGAGAVVAELVREAKPDVGPLSPSMNIELDLGFDSLARVELLGLVEERIGAHVDEKRAAGLYTLGELIEALETSRTGEAVLGRRWKEIIDVPPGDDLNQHYILKPNRLAFWVGFGVLKALKLLSLVMFRLRWTGLENLPSTRPFILCPNHESFLDAPLLTAILPRRELSDLFSLGYSDYWNSSLTSRFAQWCKIVAIDPNVNLVRAMQVGAVGLKHKKILLIFPEGTRSIDGLVADFKKGAAILAFELSAPIVPVGIRGTWEAWPRGGRFRLHPVEIVFGKPIDPLAFEDSQDPYLAITERLRTDVKKLTGEE